MQRKRDWRSRLQQWAAALVGRPFAWGTTDCASLARSALIEMFGEEITPRLPFWYNVRGAVLVLQERGSIGQILEELGATRTSVPFMRAGDLVVSAEPEEKVGHESVMVCIDGQQCLAGTLEYGVVMMNPVPEATVYSLWEVPLG